MGKEDVDIYNEILFSEKKEGNPDIWDMHEINEISQKIKTNATQYHFNEEF